MSQDNRNLEPLRGPSVWTQPRWAGRGGARDVDRWLVGTAGAALIAVGVSRRARAGAPLVAAGAGLLALAASSDALRRARAWVEHRRLRRDRDDAVTDASDSSFPASDSPSWTPTSSSGISDRRPRKGR